MSQSNVSGFTLAELLIALAILGMISVFAIPKLFSSMNGSQKNTVFKETIASLAGALEQGLKTADFSANSNGDSYFLTHLNATKVCTGDSAAQGCWNTTLQGDPAYESHEPGLIMHNGAVIVGFANTNNQSQGVLIDWNGVKGPNVIGDDQLYTGYCLQATCNSVWLQGTGARGIGAVGVSRMGSAVDIALFQSIYQ